MSYLECEEKQVEFDGVKVEFNGQKFYVSGTANHVVYKNDNGIGPYEFWGHREFQKKIEWRSESSEMTISDLQVYDQQNRDVPMTDELMDKISEYVFEYTFRKAEEKCE